MVTEQRSSVFEIDAVLTCLAKKRPVFHSECDFQIEFGWAVRAALPGAQVRAEWPPPSRPGWHIDLLAVEGSDRTLIELKYPTAQLDAIVGDEEFRLRAGATDVSMASYWNDVARVEQAVLVDGVAGRGFAIMLTNEHLFWDEPRSQKVKFMQFHTHEGARHGPGMLECDPSASKSTRNQCPSCELLGGYTVHWQPYSDLGRLDGAHVVGAGEFRFAAIEVKGLATEGR